jgi:hypothetical protein
LGTERFCKSIYHYRTNHNFEEFAKDALAGNDLLKGGVITKKHRCFYLHDNYYCPFTNYDEDKPIFAIATYLRNKKRFWLDG